jgi:hypothetical protein
MVVCGIKHGKCLKGSSIGSRICLLLKGTAENIYSHPNILRLRVRGLWVLRTSRMTMMTSSILYTQPTGALYLTFLPEFHLCMPFHRTSDFALGRVAWRA